MPSGFSDTAFASRVSPRALRALRPAGFPHRRSITESERGSYPHRLVPSGFPDTAFASRVSPRALRALRPAGFPHTRPAATFSKKSQKIAIFLLKKATQPRKNLSFAWKILSFFTQKDLPASLKTEFLHKKMTKKVLKKVPKRPPRPAKTEVLHEKNCLFLLKKPPSPAKNWRILKKNPDPQLYQTFKPIRNFFCTFLLI